MSHSFRFNVLNQLENISARITLYELLRLSMAIRDALREALADAEGFINLGPFMHPWRRAKKSSNIMSFTCITFSQEDMQVLGMYDKPLYFTGYLGSTKVNRILVDLGSMLSIIPRQLMQHLGISATQFSFADHNLWLQCRWCMPVGKNQAQVPS